MFDVNWKLLKFNSCIRGQLPHIVNSVTFSNYLEFNYRFHFQAKNADFFAQYITEDFSTYLARKRMESCHGNHIEMQAMCELYNRPIEVYQYSLGKYMYDI